MLGRELHGVGAAFSDRLAILRAWGEFVERHAYHHEVNAAGGISTSSGFASHTNTTAANASALAELVERDVFLSCWLTNTPAIEVLPAGVLGASDLTKLHSLSKAGYKVRFGVYGTCLGQLVGILAVYSDEHFVISTAAKPNAAALLNQLTLEAAIAVSDLLSASRPEPISTLSSTAAPLDHLRFYLKHSGEEFCSRWLVASGTPPEFPPFEYQFYPKTHRSRFAVASNYVVSRAVGKGSQPLWFGPTSPEAVNLARVRQIAGKEIRYEELNQEPHPLA